jgi:hypothetical protein
MRRNPRHPQIAVWLGTRNSQGRLDTLPAADRVVTIIHLYLGRWAVADIRVDPEGLERVGRSLQQIAEHLAYTVPGNAPDGTGPPGWTAWPAMLAVGRLWAAELEVVTGDVAAAGEHAVTVARAYTATDTARAREFATSPGDWP